MLEIIIAVPAGARLAGMEHDIESACRAEGLRQTLKGTLAQYPGCVHWHVKQGRERGTLEITFWPAERRLWFKVAEGRRGEWMEFVSFVVKAFTLTGINHHVQYYL